MYTTAALLCFRLMLVESRLGDVDSNHDWRIQSPLFYH